MTLFGSITAPLDEAEAAALLDQWTASLPDRLTWFRAVVPAHLAEARLADLADLVSVVHTDRHEAHSVTDPPVWWTGDLSRSFSAHGAALADGLIAAVAALVQQRTGASWRLGEDPDSPYFRQPVLLGDQAPPWRQVFAALNRCDRGQAGGSWLQSAVERTLAASPPVARPTEPPVMAAVEPAGLADWDLRVTLSEGAADVMGFAAYAALEEQLSALPGVVAAIGEDREEFLLRTDGPPDTAAVQRGIDALLARHA